MRFNLHPAGPFLLLLLLTITVSAQSPPRTEIDDLENTLVTLKTPEEREQLLDDDGSFWLLLQSSAGPAMFNLSAISLNPITNETKEIGCNNVAGRVS